MVRLMPTYGGEYDRFQSMPLAIGLFVSVCALVALCAKHSYKFGTSPDPDSDIGSSGDLSSDSKIPPRSPLRVPAQLLGGIMGKTSSFIQKKRYAEKNDIGFGDGLLWQKNILMGEKCQPPEFSGVIYYDTNGNQVSQLPPKSPLRSPLSSSFSFPVAKHIK
ncbi:hypothetical protein GIB67_038438 [Kingdonia uniflora]|uniref:Uncharacterized protein n=1 Tax=Kingdonia uniflora TaxID=39325 RepID=A0A7J7NP26_9MAGN|nr:hypothetical protein GIB67_038438 [Kingdonia uniflora]